MKRRLRTWIITAAVATTTARLAAAAPVYDWTKTPDKVTDPASASPYVEPDFESRATLGDTMAWIKRALEQYGTVKADPYDPDTTQIVNVFAKDCSLAWEEKRYIAGGTQLNDSKYSVRLQDLDLRYGAVMVGGKTVRISTTGSNSEDPRFRVVQESFVVERGRERSKGGPRTAAEPQAIITVQDKDDISRRLGHALFHGARLCGAKAGR
jgi:hypothetical protein